MSEHDKYIRRCFELAELGRGNVEPNPVVGAVIVKDGKVISEGWHQVFGGAHAEVEAFNNASESVEGATLYCNLEPCCHTDKKTPPCTPLVIKKGILEVIISNIDPNPKVSGQGTEQLRKAGIKVVQGILEDEGKELNKEFFKQFIP